MSTRTSTMHEFMSALADVLQSREALTGVDIASGPLGVDTNRSESIHLFGSPERIASTGSQQWAALGNRSREEQYQVAGRVFVSRIGGDEPVIREARARAFELFRELELALRADPAVLAIVRTAEIDRFTLSQGAEESMGRVALIDFEISVRQRLPT